MAVLLTAVPSGLIAWSDQGIGIAIVLFRAHVYVGAFCLFVLPWLLRRQHLIPFTRRNETMTSASPGFRQT